MLRDVGYQSKCAEGLGAHIYLLGHLGGSWDLWIAPWISGWLLGHMDVFWDLWVIRVVPEWLLGHLDGIWHPFLSPCPCGAGLHNLSVLQPPVWGSDSR